MEPRSTIDVAPYAQAVTLDGAIPRCNIGPDEIAKRRQSAVVGSVVVAVVAVALVALRVPAPARLLFWPLATGAAVMWLQVVHRFCVAFGALGLENFGRRGSQVHVDPRLRAADRRRVLQLVLEGSLIGLVVTLVLVAIPA